MGKVKCLLCRLTGGRPMRRYGPEFTLLGRSYWQFIDQFGRRWCARHSWSLTRVGWMSHDNEVYERKLS